MVEEEEVVMGEEEVAVEAEEFRCSKDKPFSQQHRHQPK